MAKRMTRSKLYRAILRGMKYSLNRVAVISRDDSFF